ncbi:MAG: hypothetical protein PGN09_02650 [Sphingomonas fennica]
MSIGIVALIAAFEPTSPEDATPAAARAFAGATVLEHQARRAVRAGATRLIVLSDAAHPALTAIVQRLRRDALPVELAVGMSDAADRLHPSEPVLVIADACLVPEQEMARVAHAPPPVLLTVADLPGRDLFERIDASARWAGVALLDGTMVRETAEMLGEWDALSVLLRRAVQADARRIPAPEHGDDALPIVAFAAQGLAGMERRLVAGTRIAGSDWPARLVYPPIEDAVLPPLFRRQIDPWWLAAGAAALGVLAAALTGYLLIGALILLLLSGPVESIAARLARIRAAEIRRGRLFARIRIAGAAVALIGLGRAVAAGGQWGWWLVAGLTLAAMAALVVERRSLAAVDAGAADRAPWLASADGLLWVVLPFGLTGFWGAGLTVAAAYAFVSFGWVQRRLGQAVRR